MSNFPNVPGRRVFRGLVIETDQTETILAEDMAEAIWTMKFRHGPEYMGGQRRWSVIEIPIEEE